MSGLLMESVVALVAEWISLGEMFKLQELCTSVSDVLREWQGNETMESLGDQTWNDISEEWAEFMYNEGKKHLNVQACCETGMGGCG